MKTINRILSYIQYILWFFLFIAFCVACSACSSVNNLQNEDEEPETVQYPALTEGCDDINPGYVELGGNRYGRDRQYLILKSDKICEDDLLEAIPQFYNLKSVDIRDTSLSAEEGIELTELFPEVTFIWNNRVFGKEYQSNVLEIDISGNNVKDTYQAAEIVRLFPKLKKIVMSDCGISDEDMDYLNRKYKDIQFVWTVHFSIYSLRTDAEYFCASDLPKRGNIAPRLNEKQLEPIKYCTDLVALDLGHMNYTNIDFLSGMTKLRYLILVQSPFEDLSPIANMPELEYLELFANNHIKDLTPLLKCKTLKHLNIGYCDHVEWETLKEMKQLERLWVPHVRMSPEEKQDLIEALPDTYVYCPGSDPKGSTGGGWREDKSYFDMRDALHIFYLPGGTGI